MVGASLFGSNIGSEHFVGLAGTGAIAGISVGIYEWTAMLLLIFLGYYFVPVYLASNVSTLPEYIQKRLGGKRIQIYLTVLSLILYVFTKISANLYAGAIFIQEAIDINIYLAIIILLGVTGVYTVLVILLKKPTPSSIA